MTTQPAFKFYAMPDSPHLTLTHCGYTLLTLQGLDEKITADQVVEISINGVPHEFKTLGDRTLALIPAFKQEAQTICVLQRGEDNPIREWTKPSITAPPDLSMGLSPLPHNIYRKAP